MNRYDIEDAVDGNEVGNGLYAAVWKATQDGVECKLCLRTEEGLKSIGSLTILVSDETPNISVVACLPLQMDFEPNLDLMVGKILGLLGKPDDETYQAALYRFDRNLTTFSSRRSNDRQSPSWL